MSNGNNNTDWFSEYTRINDEYKEYQQSSCELEQVLENEINRITSDYNRVMKKQNVYINRIETLESQNKTSSNEIVGMQKQLAQAHNTITELSTTNRRLEQTCDNLQRAQRILLAKNSDYEEKLERVEEDFVLLSQEHDDVKAELIEIKRLYDRLKASDQRGDMNITATPIRKAQLHRSNSETLASLARQSLFDGDTSFNMSIVSDPGNKTPLKQLQPTKQTVAPNTAPSNNNNNNNRSLRRRALTRMMTTPPKSMDDMVQAAGAIVTTPYTLSSSSTPTQQQQHTRQRSVTLPLDSHIQKRYISILQVGHKFKKTRHRSVTKRWIWVSKTLQYVIWGWCTNQNNRTIRGFIKTSDITSVVSGNGNADRKIFLCTPGRTLELEAPDYSVHRDFFNAFTYLIQHQREQENIWTAILMNPQKVSHVYEKYTNACTFLKQGIHIILHTKQKHYKRIMCFNESMDRLQLLRTDTGKVYTHILYDDLCDIADMIMKQQHAIEIRGVRKTICVIFNNLDLKLQWMDSFCYMMIHRNRLECL